MRIKKYITPAIAVPVQMPAVIWWERPIDDEKSDGSDLYSILESKKQALTYVKEKRHQWDRIIPLINRAWPNEK